MVRATGLHPVGPRFESEVVHFLITFLMQHILSVLVENKFGVLARIAGLFSGRGFNIETLNVGPMEDARYSRITAVVLGDDNAQDQCVKQLSKLVNVIEVKDFSHGKPFVARELILIKVRTTPQSRSELIEICELFRAKIIDVSLHSMNIEVTGNVNKIKGFLNLIHSFEIIEMARTGNVVLSRGDADSFLSA